MKSASAGLITHLGQEVTTLATCWKVTRRDGTVIAATDHDRDLRLNADGVGLQTYAALTGYRRSAIGQSSGLGVDTVEVEGVLDAAAITEADLEAGLYDGAEVKIFLVNWANLGQGVLKMHNGYLGQIQRQRDGFRAELRGLSSLLQQPLGELITPDCRADLGDSRCQVVLTPAAWAPGTVYAVGTRVRALAGAHPLRLFRCTTAGTSGGGEPAWDTTIGNTTADNTVGWTTHLAFTVACTVDSLAAPVLGDLRVQTLTVTPALTDFIAVPAGAAPYFAWGLVTWTGGGNSGQTVVIRDFLPASSTISLWLPPVSPIQVGDTLTLIVGCDKRRLTCRDKFHNIVNMRGEPFTPGLDEALQYPDAPTS